MIRFYRMANSFCVNRCNNCGLLFIGNIRESDIKDLYEREYYNNERTSLIGYKNYFAGYQADYYNFIRFDKVLKKQGNGGRRLFDAGAGMGGMVRIMIDRGWDASGIDPSKYAIKTGIQMHGVDLQQSTIQDFRPDGRFDVITLIGVLEHLIYPNKDLIKLHGMLNPGGIVLITTIDAGLKLFKLKPPEHIFYFNRAQIRQLLTRTGFAILKINWFFRYYRLSDFIGRVGGLLFPSLTGTIDRFFRVFPGLDVITRCPTNEMCILAKKKL